MSMHPVMVIYLAKLMRRVNNSLVEVCNGDSIHDGPIFESQHGATRPENTSSTHFLPGQYEE